MSESPTRIVVTDTSVLINFAWIGRLELLRGLTGMEFWVSPMVLMEVKLPELRQRVEEALEAGCIRIIEPTTLEQEAIGRILQEDRLDPGEAECLAIAAERGCWIACDESNARFQRVQRRLLGEGRCVTTLDLVVAGLDRGVLGLEEADGFLEVWRQRRFRAAIASFAERWTPPENADRVSEAVGGMAQVRG